MQAVVLSMMLAIGASAQVVQVDSTPSHVANTFSPLQALGATLDRIPSNTTDIFFRPDQIKQILDAGWGPHHAIARTPNYLSRPGTGTPKGNGAIRPEGAISSATPILPRK